MASGRLVSTLLVYLFTIGSLGARAPTIGPPQSLFVHPGSVKLQPLPPSQLPSLRAKLSGAQEVPPSGSLATGSAQLSYDHATGMLTYSVTTLGIQGAAAHVHLGATGINGPVLIPLSGGPVDWSGAAGPLSPNDETALFNGGLYINVHSAAFPGGEIRGQFRPIQDGLPHEPLGAGVISYAAGELVVSNIGSSGLDGVRVDLGESNGWGFSLDDFGPLGAYREWTMRAQVNGVPDQVNFTARIAVVPDPLGDRLEYSHDHSAVGATQLGVNFYATDGTLLHSTTLPNGPLFTADCCPFPCIKAKWDKTCVVEPIPPLLMVAGDGVTVPNVAWVEYRALDATQTVDFCSAVDSFASNIPSITLDDEVLGMFGQPHAAQGQAFFDAEGGKLKVSNLGSSGCDGFSVVLDEADSFDAVWELLDPAGTAPPGASITAEAEGVLGGVPDQALGTLTFTKNGGPVGMFDVTADFSSFAAATQLVQVFDNGTLVVSFPGHPGPVATVSSWPCGIGKLGGQTECLVSKHDSGTSFLISGAVFQGDELRVLAEGVTSPISYKSAFRVLAANVPEIVLTAESQVAVIRASETPRFGNPTNPGTLQSGGLPILGTSWTPSVVGVTSSLDVLLLDPLALTLNIPIPYGTLLCNLPPSNFQFFGAPTQPFVIPIPADLSLIGTPLCAQGAGITFSPLDFNLTNALDLVLGQF